MEKFRFRIVSALIGFFLGILCCLFWQLLFHGIFGFHILKNPMSKTQEENTAPNFSATLEQLMHDQLGDEGVGEVQQREDDYFYYYDISIKGLDRQSLNVEVKDGQIFLKGQIHLANNAGGEMLESFNRSFTAPPNVDPQKVDIENTQDTLTLKFPKTDVDTE